MTQVENQGSSVTTLSAPDITCGGCANTIRKAVGSLNGVDSVSVDIDAKTVVARHAAALGETDLLAALNRAGFPATVQPTQETTSSGGSKNSSCSCCGEK